MRGLTKYAQTVLNELSQLRWTSMFLHGDALRAHGRLDAEHQSKNAQYIGFASRILGIQQLTQSVDLYNWYCREVLKLAVISNPDEVIATLEAAEGAIKVNIARAKKAGRTPGAEIIGRFSKPNVSEGAVRKAIHKHLGIIEKPETDVLCACRNSLVHNMGRDEGGLIAESLREMGSEMAMIYPPNWPTGHYPIQLTDEGDLVIDFEIGSWASDLISKQIHLMDQKLSAAHNLPTERWRPRPISHSVT